MNLLMRSITALCTVLLLGLVSPAFAQKATLSTADPQVCCSGTDAAGNKIFFLAPKSQCPRKQVVALERCKGTTSRPVCCRTPNGFFKVGSAERCKAAGGAIAPNQYCEKRDPVCCKTPNGFVKVLPDRCKAAGGTIVSGRYCQTNRRVCCKTPNGYYDWTAVQCRRARGTVVNARYCRSQARKVCCKYTKPDGTVAYGFLDPRRCKRLKGSKVSNRYCLRATDRLKLRRN